MENEKIIEIADLREKLQGIPRPHYLSGSGRLIHRGRKVSLTGNVIFASDRNPSIKDRTDKYLKNPHVNVADCAFAFWNAAHIIADYLGYTTRTLVDEVRFIPEKLISPDTELDLYLMAEEKRSIGNTCLGVLEGAISMESEPLIRVSAKYLSEKP